MTENRETNAWLWGSLTFSWATRLFSLTKRKNKLGEELEQDELLMLGNAEKTAVLTAKFDKRWNRFMENTPPEERTHAKAKIEFKWALWGVVRKEMLLAGVFRLINSLIQIANPFVISELLTYIQEVDIRPVTDGIFWAVMLGAVSFLKALIENRFFWLVQRAGWRARSVVSTSVYNKSLKLSASARQTMSQGQIVNLMQLDAEKLERFAPFFHVLWDSVLQIVGYTALVYVYIQEAVFVGLAVLILAMPLQAYLVIKFFGYQSKVVKVTDKRVKASNEALQSMLAVKMAAWEENFMKRINKFREEELRIFRASLLIRSALFAMMSSIPAFAAVGGLTYFGLTADVVEASILFAALNGFGSLRFPLFQVPVAISTYTDAKISQGRLAKFLSLEESNTLDESETGKESKSAKNEIPVEIDNDIAVDVTDGEFYWTIGEPGGEATKVAALEGINMQIKKGSLVGIVGSVGSGKSTLLNALIGELVQTKGTRKVYGTLGYAAQTAWILNVTLKENVLFACDFDAHRYRKVINVCQLRSDLKLLQNGDETVIGERGINLSGGQAQRVSVARAAYSDADIILLDDPLSALDPEVAKKLFNDCIVGFMGDKTRIMVTNQLNFLEQCDYVIALAGAGGESAEGEEVKRSPSNGGSVGPAAEVEERQEPGRIMEQGTFKELMSKGGDFASMLNKFQGEKSDKQKPSELVDMKRMSSVGHVPSSSALAMNSQADELMQKEERTKGAVTWSKYMLYIRAGSICLFVFSFVLLVIAQLGSVGTEYVVSFWSDDPFYEKQSIEFYLALYGGVALVVGVFQFFRTYYFFVVGVNASKNLHASLLEGIFRAPMSFFDTTPTGRIVARMSRDIFSLDTELPQNMSFFILSTLMVVVSAIVVVVQIPTFILALPVMAGVYLYLMQMYRPTARDCKRLESITRSPIYAHFGETLTGLSSLRAFGKVDTFVKKNEMNIDNSIRANFGVRVVERWLSVRLQLLSAFMSTAAALLIVLSAVLFGLSPGLAGLAVSQVLSMTSLLGQTVSGFVLVETGMNAVERIDHYGKNIEREADQELDESKVPANWPSKGEVVFENVTMRYRENTPLVLKGVNVVIPGGSTCGIVGRTGCGKSSLMLSLLRIVERETGSIRLDGVDTASLNLQQLRKKISIVPQSPVMFSGTVRSNLDPFEIYKEDQLWAVLKQVNLDQVMTNLEDGLDSEVAEYGENFSQGQRQLICMARSLLAQAKVLLLDEATSSVDYETDSMIQAAVRNGFADCTILTIAHRVQTIVDNDNILVMKDGIAAEFGPPSQLVTKQNSEFAKVIAELGPDAEANVREFLSR